MLCKAIRELSVLGCRWCSRMGWRVEGFSVVMSVDDGSENGGDNGVVMKIMVITVR